MFKKLLIANRGEIAVRLIRACRDLDIASVAVYSDLDVDSVHTKLADEAYNIGPAPSKDSYLNIDKIIEVCKKANVDAVHPGYGFLSESDAFAERLKKEGITTPSNSCHKSRFTGCSDQDNRLSKYRVINRTNSHKMSAITNPPAISI